MYETLLKTVTNLGTPKVLVAGDFMLDIYVYGNASHISPEAPVPVLNVTKINYRCGGAGSVVTNLAAMKAQPLCLGILGHDQNAEKLRQLITQTGTKTDGLLTIDNRPTTAKQRIVGLAQHRHRQQLMRIDHENTEPLSDEQYEKILQIYHNNLQQADIVCLQDYNKGLLSSSICSQMIQSAKKINKKILVDPAFGCDYSKYHGATLITPNRLEAATAVGFEIKTAADAAKAAEQLIEKHDFEAVIITLDKEGAFLKTENISEIIPTRPRSVYDVTGAGDTVLATLAVVLAADSDYRIAVNLANIAGGIEVERFGAATVTIEEIINEIISQEHGTGGKVIPTNSLPVKLSRHRKYNQHIVFTNGCFDVLHRGHIEFLKFCKSHGDILVVGLNSDSSVRTIKGPDRPINNQYDRAAVLVALEPVDYVTVFDEPDPLNLIKTVRPDVLVKGKDWEHKGVVGREFVESSGGKVVLAPLVQGQSSTSTIEKIKALEEKSS